MRAQRVVFFMLIWLFPVISWAENRNGVSGSDSAYWQAIVQPNLSITVLRNAVQAAAQPGGLTPSFPAMTRVGSTLYLVYRATDNKIYCARSAYPYGSWTPWQYVNGQTLDAPAIASTGSRVWAFVRGIDARLYYADLTNCPSAAAWSSLPVSMQYTPAAAADPSGVYVLYFNSDGYLIRWKLGTGINIPQVRTFGWDQDATGGGVYVHQYTDQEPPVGIFQHSPPPDHRAIYIPPADVLTLSGTSSCPTNTPPLLALGGPSTSLCYVPDSSTGDFLIRKAMLSGGTPGFAYQYNWRSCMGGNSFGMFTDDCELYTQLDWFRGINYTHQINLRAWVTATGSPAGQSGYISLVFRLKNLLSSEEIELHFIPYWYAQSGCFEIDGGHDPDGRHVFAFTAACVGAQNLGSGQSRFYNVDLRSYITQRFGDFFRGFHGDIDPIVNHWAVTWGLAVETVKAGSSHLITSVQHVALDHVC